MAPSVFNDQIENSIFLNILSNPANLGYAAIIFGIVLIASRVLGDPLRRVPGPLLARFTKLWQLRTLRARQFEKVNLDLHEQHGPVVRIAPNTYSINDVPAMKTIYGFGSKFTKSDFYDTWSGGPEPNLFSARDPHHHAQARRQLASLYSMSTMVSYEQFVDRCTHELMSKLRLFADKKQALDVPAWMQYYAFDVIGEITVGKPFGMMEFGYDSTGILGAIHANLIYGANLGWYAPSLHKWIMKTTTALGLSNPVQPFQDFMSVRITERRNGKTTTDRDDFLAKVLTLQAEGKIDDVSIMNSVSANVFAGSDTTAISLSSVVYYLLKYPDCKEKLQKEIQEFESEGKISNPATFAEAQSMPYLQAVIKEALRMHPAVGLPLLRVVPEGGAEISGYYFPAGSIVGVNAWVLHQNQEIFGAEVEHFRPERWLRSKEELSPMNENLFSFGAGSRTCIGKNISLLEMNKIIIQMYRNFNFEHVKPAAPTEWSTENLWFVKQSFECRVAPRS